jgi:hypothetical protein
MIGAPVTAFVPNVELTPLKQCAAVSITVGERSVPEQAVVPLSAKPTYGWASLSYCPPVIAPPGATATSAQVVKIASRSEFRAATVLVGIGTIAPGPEPDSRDFPL